MAEMPQFEKAYVPTRFWLGTPVDDGPADFTILLEVMEEGDTSDQRGIIPLKLPSKENALLFLDSIKAAIQSI